MFLHCCEDRGFRLPDVRDGRKTLPSSAEGFVDGGELRDGRLPRLRVLVFDRVKLALRVHHVEEVDNSLLVAAGGNVESALGSRLGGEQLLLAIARGLVS